MNEKASPQHSILIPSPAPIAKPSNAPLSKGLSSAPWVVRPVLWFVVLALILAAACSGHAGPRAWTGAGSNPYWSTAANWSPSGAPQSGDDLIFPEGAARQSSTNDLTHGNYNSILFNGPSSTYSLWGFAITLQSGVSALAVPGGAEINFDITLGTNSSFLADGSQLRIYNSVDLGGHNLTLKANSSNAVLTVFGEIKGMGNISTTGFGQTRLYGSGANTYIGNLDINEGTLRLGKLGGYAVTGPVLLIGDPYTSIVLDQSQMLSPSALFQLDGGQFDLNGHDQTLGPLEISSGVIDSQGGTLILNGPVTNYYGDSDTVQIRGTVYLPATVTFGILDTRLYMDAQVTGPGGVDLESGILSLDNSNTFSGPVSVNHYSTLDLVNDHALGAAPGVTLDGISWLLLEANITNKTLSIYNTNSGITAGVALKTWAGPIYLNLSGMAMCDGPLSLAGPIHGTGGFLYGGSSVELLGDNDYTGPTRAASTLLLLNNGGGRPFSGSLEVGGEYRIFNQVFDLNWYTAYNPTAEIRWTQNQQYSSHPVTLLDTNAFINLTNHNDTFGAVTFNNGGRIDTGSGVLTLAGDIAAVSSNATATVNGHVLLPADIHINIADGTANPDMAINAIISDSSSSAIYKQGLGELQLTAANTYRGPTLVQAGVLQVMNDQALGGTTFGTTVSSNATVEVSNLTQNFSEVLEIIGSGRYGTNGALSCRVGSTISSLVLLDGPTTICNYDTGAQFLIFNRVSGTGPLTKSGPGVLNLGGATGNTYTGDTTVTQGNLWLSKTTTAPAVPGNLIIGPAPAGSTVSAAWFQSPSVGGDTITVNGGSLLNLNNNNQVLLNLSLNDGGSVQTGAGLLSFSANGTVNVGSLNFLGSRASASISGKINLPNNAGSYVTFNVGHYNSIFGGPALPELDVPATVSSSSSAFDHGLIKAGGGQMRFGGNNTFFGRTMVNGGTLIAASATALGAATPANDTEVNSNAVLAIDGGFSIANETLLLASSATPALDSRSGSNGWTGPVTLNANAVVNIATNGYLQVSGSVNGVGGLTKTGPGTLQFRGSTSNSYGGQTIVSGGIVEAGRTNVTSIPGDVVIGDDSGTNITATLRSILGQQLQPTANVNIKSSGLLDLIHTNSLTPPTQSLRTMTGHGQAHVDFLCTLSISNDVPFDFYGFFNAHQAQPFNKYGAGMLRAWGNWDCPNGISINNGDFWFNGTAQSADAQSGARLRGGGRFTTAASVEPGGFLGADSASPDHQGGTMSIADLELNAGATVQMDLFGPSPTGGNDQFVVALAILRSASLTVNFNYPPHDGDVITLINKTNSGAIIGTFTNWPAGLKQVATVPVLVNYAGGDGNDLTLTVTNLALASVGYRLAEGNGNQTAEPNECNLLYVTLVNRRAVPETITNAFLRAITPGALATIANATYPVIPAGGSHENTTAFQFRTDTNLPCGQSVSFELVVSVTGEGQFAIPFTVVAGTDCSHPTGPCDSCTVVAGQFTTNTPTLSQPLFFTGAPSICYPAKAYPGIDPATNLPPVSYITHTFTNTTTGPLCISALLQYDCPGGPANALGVAAFLGGFNPADPSAGYLGDIGVGGPPYPPFAFQVPAGSNFVLVVSARATNLVCNNYSLQLFGLPCPLPTLAISPEATPAKVRVQWSTAYPGWTALQAGKLSSTFTNLSQLPVILNGRYSVTNIPAVTNQFYRLKK